MRNLVWILLAVVLAVIGLWLGTPEPGETFGATLHAFAQDGKTRLIIVAILADLVTGVASALKLGTFNVEALAKFHATNVLPYVLAYLMIWGLQQFGFNDALPSALQDVLAAGSFGIITTTLAGSIAKNTQCLFGTLTTP